MNFQCRENFGEMWQANCDGELIRRCYKGIWNVKNFREVSDGLTFLGNNLFVQRFARLMHIMSAKQDPCDNCVCNVSLSLVLSCHFFVWHKTSEFKLFSSFFPSNRKSFKKFVKTYRFLRKTYRFFLTMLHYLESPWINLVESYTYHTQRLSRKSS